MNITGINLIFLAAVSWAMFYFDSCEYDFAAGVTSACIALAVMSVVANKLNTKAE